MITGGENVWPEPVERILRGDPRIADVAVVGRPSAEWGSELVAVIELTAPGRLPRLEELRDLVKAELPAPHAPRHLLVVDELPRTALGKPRRDLIRRLASAG
ncbi:MAG: class I adenylate-forming enzyme family protein [Ilumatobacteraceae bacterium]